MSTIQRGGHTLKTGKIGKTNCLRQQIMMPGEKIDLSMQGSVRLESLRERDVMRINAHLATFMTPLRWVCPNWTKYVKEGPDTQEVIATESWFNFDEIGLGARDELGGQFVFSHFVNAYLRVYNEWYKWPENDDATSADLKGNGGLPACPLSKTWSRMRLTGRPEDTADYLQNVTTTFDVRELAETQARFRAAMKRDVLSFNRWMELVKESWNGDGSREVDQVPIMLDQVEVGVNPREIPATDGASLGQWQSLFDFKIDHQIPSIIAPEHCILTTVLLVRFAATTESKHPLSHPTGNNWAEMVGDPEYLSAAKPVPVTGNQIFLQQSANQLGYLPSGWQWRSDHDVVGAYIDVRDSFPYSLVPTTAAEAKDATRVKSAFRSQALEDYVIDCFFKENSRQPIGDSMDSYFSGMADHTVVKSGGKNEEFPKGGKNL